MRRTKINLISFFVAASMSSVAPAALFADDIPVYPLNEVFFGNLHVHTSYSFDGYTNGSVTDPVDAYAWARGEAIPGGGGGGDMQIKVPLDWYAVSDHAEYLGVFKKMEDPNSPFSKLPIAEQVTSDDAAVAFAAYSNVLNEMSEGKSDPDLSDPVTATTIWKEVVQTADDAYQPGVFTTFPAFEWTSNPGQRNLHRVVLFQTSQGVPDIPFSALDSDKPEDLWAWMDGLREAGATLLAVPHNGNASNGIMFAEDGNDSFVNPIDATYSETRNRNEPLYEITQIKGSSDTHPQLSPNDEFANFEIWNYTLSADAKPGTEMVGSYARDAFLRGLAMEAEGRGNPFKYGLIGDSDTHNSASTIEEDNYTGKFAFENTPEDRHFGPEGFPEPNKKQAREFGSAGVAGVWAKSNTREAIYEALLNRETFGTSGPRIRLRVFGGSDFDDRLMDQPNWVEIGYDIGVPMGGDLSVTEGAVPKLAIAALKEPHGANLDRIQVIKGFVDADGALTEVIYNVALSDGREVDAEGNATDVGNTVDTTTATYTNSIGAIQLSALWTDPEFDPNQHAFYYVRVLEIPTPRWSTYDAVRLGLEIRDDVPAFIRERAWSSPIWYTPES
ncbi:MAG: DUF3604 domain-containing protein [Paracoccaceae bacterium]|nr:DUF3604 domain-containing protein [Paracoccaceae bacterium]